MLWRIVAPHFVAGMLVDPKRGVYKYAPILRFMARWDMNQIEEYCRIKGWTINKLKEG